MQKEVIQETLATDFGIDVEFRETTTICVERLVGTGAAVEIIGRAPNPFRATVGLRVEPGAVGSGVTFGLEVELGSMPLAFFRAVEDTVRETLRQGLCGWQVLDCAVTMTHSGYSSPTSTAGDFRLLTPLVLMSALKEAGTVVCEPIHRFRIDAPMDTVGHVLSALARLDAVPQAPAVRGSSSTIEGDIAAARVHELRLELPGLTRGEGVLECEFGRYEPVNGHAPTRPRSDWNPLNREAIPGFSKSRAVLSILTSTSPWSRTPGMRIGRAPRSGRSSKTRRTHSTTAGRRTPGTFCTRTTKRAATAPSTVVARASFGRSTRCSERGLVELRRITSRTSTARTSLTFPMTIETGASWTARRESGSCSTGSHRRARTPTGSPSWSPQNAEDEHCELFWGSPGTMLAAAAMHELTGEARWLDLWRESAAWLIDEWDPQTDLWTQRFPGGQVEQWIGPAHGFAGCVLALSRACGRRRSSPRGEGHGSVRNRGGRARELEADRCHGEPALQPGRVHPDAVVSRRAGHRDVVGSGGARRRRAQSLASRGR